MKILCISNFYPPFFEGGYEISVSETMEYLSTRGHSVYIVCGEKGSEEKPVPPSAIPTIGKPLRILKYIDYHKSGFMAKHQVERFNYKVIKRLLMQLKPDLVYLGNMKALSIAPVIAVQDMKQCHIFDLGDIWLRSYLAPGIKSSIFRWLKARLPFTIGGRIILDPVIVLSQWMEDEVKREYLSKHVSIVPRGIRLPEINPRALQKPLKFVFAGRIEPLKGLDLCISAMSQLREQYNLKIELDIYGEEDAAYAASCRDLIKKCKLETDVCFKGKSLSLQQILMDYDVFLMPTLAREAFGRVIIEAMAASMIVIATDAYGPKEIITSGVDGFLFTSGSSDMLAQTILHINSLSLDELERIRIKARQKVQAQYEISLVKKRIEIILENEVKRNLADSEVQHAKN